MKRENLLEKSSLRTVEIVELRLYLLRFIMKFSLTSRKAVIK